MPGIGLVTFVVREYDEAIAFFVDALGFELVEDSPQGDKRWVVVRPPASRGSGDSGDPGGGTGGAGLLLARAATPQQSARVGDQTGGRVGFFLQTDDFARDHARMTAAGVRFREEPRHEVYGTVAVFEDLYGNTWDLLEPA